MPPLKTLHTAPVYGTLHTNIVESVFVLWNNYKRMMQEHNIMAAVECGAVSKMIRNQHKYK